MVTSQNGWPAPPARLATFPWITGKVCAGDVYTVFKYLCERFNAEVEKINKAWSWGYDPRPIRGSTTLSNHASGTAIDLNAPKHPLGASGTFSAAQTAAIQKILTDLEGTVRWGGNFSGRKDEMHFGVFTTAAGLRSIAEKIRDKRLPGQVQEWIPSPSAISDLGIIQGQFRIAQGLDRGIIRRYHGTGNIQIALNKRYQAGLIVDGYVGKATVAAWKTHELRVGGTGRAATPDMLSLSRIGLGRNFRE
jgi:D-alanyl-D-alanine carboxypeptidase